MAAILTAALTVTTFGGMTVKADDTEVALPVAAEMTQNEEVFLPEENVEIGGADEDIVGSYADGIAALQTAIANRQTTIKVSISGSDSVLNQIKATNLYTVEGQKAAWNILYANLFKHDGVANHGDYLEDAMSNYSHSIAPTADGVTVTVKNITYISNAAQEQAVASKLNSVMASLNLNGKSDYAKVKAIYDYITNHVKYDNAHLGNNSYLLQYSAYAALCQGTSVCEGYSALFYRMCLTAGVDCRIIKGNANGAHAWNIVRVDGKYYFADPTWDTNFKPNYRYFLKHNLASHTPSSTLGYSISGSDYNAATAKAQTANAQQSSTANGKFTDVQDKTKYYFAPVYWAVNNKIANGTSADKFSPNTQCTRGQIITFIYNKYGNGAKASAPAYTDSQSGYTVNPTAWAKANNILGGNTSATTFGTSNTCTRAMAVTFLWEAAGKPQVAATTNFSDVPADSYYAQAVAWAVSKNITKGTSATTFAPNTGCTRGQIMTFVYNAANA